MFNDCLEEMHVSGMLNVAVRVVCSIDMHICFFSWVLV